MAGSEELKIIFAAEDRYTATADKVVASMGDISAKAADVGRTGPPAISQLSAAFTRLGPSIGAATALVGTFGRALSTALEFGAQGAVLANIEQSFRQFAERSGQSADDVLSSLQRMSGGMLSETQAMQQYNRAYLLMGKEMAAQFPQMIEVATKASAAGMGEFDYLLNSMVVGLGRLSAPILDNLGVTIDADQAYSAYAKTIGKTAAELSKAEKQQALLNFVMADAAEKYGETGEAAERAGLGIASLRTQITDLRDEAAKLAQSPINDIAGGLSGDLVRLGSGLGIDALAGNARSIAQMEDALANYNRRVEEGASFWEKVTGQAPNLEMMQGEVLGLAQGLDIATLSATDLSTVLALLDSAAPGAAAEFRAMNADAFQTRDALAELHGQSLMTADALVGMGGGALVAHSDLSQLNSAIGATITLVQNLTSAGLNAQGSLAAMSTSLSVSMMKAQAFARGGSQPQLKWFTTGKEMWELPDAYEAYTNAMGSWMEGQGRTLWTEHESSIRGAGGAYKDLTTDMESYYSSWASQAQGILTPTQSFDMGALEEEVYGYQEKWDENARRAMDVVKLGGDSPWAAQMGLDGKADALQYVKDFYNGLKPEDINWDAAMGDYQDKVSGQLGQENLQRLFEEQLISADMGPGSTLIGDQFTASMADAGLNAGTDAAANFTSTFTGVDWATEVGDPVGKWILNGVSSAFDSGTSKFKSSLTTMVLTIIRDYFGAGGELP